MQSFRCAGEIIYFSFKFSLRSASWRTVPETNTALVVTSKGSQSDPSDNSIVTQSKAKTYLKKYASEIRSLESASTLSFASLILSVLFVSKVFGFFILNFAYLVNISFFALIVRDSWGVRRSNPIAIAAIALSIFLTSMLLFDSLKVLDMVSSFGNLFD